AASFGARLRTPQQVTMSLTRCMPSPTIAPFSESIFCHFPNSGLLAICKHCAARDLSCAIMLVTSCMSICSAGRCLYRNRGARTAGIVGMSRRSSIPESRDTFLASIVMLPAFLPGIDPPDVRGRTGEMDQAKVIVHAEERFGAAEKQIAVRQKTLVEVLDHAAFRGEIEIDKNVATEDDVEVAHPHQARLVREIELAEGNATPQRGLNLQVFSHD